MLPPPTWFSDAVKEISAEGRQAILDFYVKQRAGTYKGATTATPVESIRFLRPELAVVNTHFQLTGLRAADGSALPVREDC